MDSYYFIFFSVFISFFVALLISKYGNRIGLDDKPTERSSHKEITPKGGGLGIFIVFIFSSLYLNLNPGFWIPIIFISLLSLYGDRIHISPKVRLLFQFLSAFIIVSGINFHSNYFINYFIMLLSVVFISGTANFYNFMDGIDGIAGLTGAIAFLSLYLYIVIYYPQSQYKELSLFISASCTGFLPLNFPKAKLFMGDVGSILLGFTFGALIILLSKNLLDFLCISGFLFTFYADELLTMTVRIKNRDSLGKPHRKHMYQLLVNELKFDHYKITFLYAIIQVLISALIIFLRNKSVLVILTLYIVISSLFTSLYFIVRRKVSKGF